MFKKITNIILTVLILVIGAIIILHFVGYPAYVVKTASMEPEIHQGSMVWIKEFKNEEQKTALEVGDVITYNAGSETVTHKIIEVDFDNFQVKTQGINGDNPIIETIKLNNIIGIVVFTIPVIGYLMNIYVLIIAILLILLAMIISAFIKQSKKQQS